MLDGGSRSGKTFVIVRAICIRALARPDTNHGIFRFRLNHVTASIRLGTFPNVIKACWPELDARKKIHYDDRMGIATFPNKSRVWFGGLDDKERTEKMLGNEYSTVYLNECSQIPWSSRNLIVTRLAENKGCRPRAWYDCNPPSRAHWTHRVFHEHRDPITRAPLPNPHNYAALKMNPRDNAENLPETYLEELANLPKRERERFMEGLYADAAIGPLWTEELIEQQRTDQVPQLRQVIVSIDPSGMEGEEDTRSDEVGIVVIGLGDDGRAYILEDISMRGSPMEWGTAACAAFDRYGADRIVAEVNFGGAMVKAVIQASRAAQGAVPVPFREIHASRGKHIRAEPVSTLFETDKVRLAGTFAAMEDQMLAMTMSGYTGSRSPDRLDAMVHGIAHLFPMVARRDSANTPTPEVIVGRQGRQAPLVQTGRRWR